MQLVSNKLLKWNACLWQLFASISKPRICRSGCLGEFGRGFCRLGGEKRLNGGCRGCRGPTRDFHHFGGSGKCRATGFLVCLCL